MNENYRQKADLVLKNGFIWTVDPSQPRAEALALRGDSILWVGSNAEVEALADSRTEVIDLGGRLVLPGFNDAHTHFIRAALQFATSFDLKNVTSLGEVQSRLREHAIRFPDYSWVYGMRWTPTKIGDGSWPSKADLDAVESSRPVSIVDVDGHARWVNSRALQELNITAETPDPAGGKILRDVSGEPSGILLESAHYPVPRFEKISLSEFEQLFPQEVSKLNKLGLTSLSDNLAEAVYRDALVPMAQNGRLNVRVNYWPQIRDGLDQALALRESFRVPDLLQVVGVKAFMDGVLGNYTAWMLEPYSDRPDLSGFSIHEPLELRSRALEADAMGFQIVIHGLGDRAVREILDIYEYVAKINPARDRRHRIEHVEAAHPIDQPRFAGLGVIPCMMPVHLTSDLNAYILTRLGAGRETHGYPWRTLYDQGSHLAFGTDWSSTDMLTPNPLENIFAAVTRQKPEDYGGQVWQPDQRLTTAQAIQCYTLEPAYAEFSEKRKGSLTPGKLADVIVLSKNILALDPLEMLDTEVDLTVFGGEVAYRNF